MTRLTALEEARIELAARILEGLEDGNLDEGLGRLLKRAALPAAFAAGMASPVGGNAARVPAKIKSPQAVVKSDADRAHLDRIKKKYDPGYDAAIKSTRGFIKDMEASDREIDKIKKDAGDVDQIPKRMKKAQDKLQTKVRGGRVTGQTGQGTFFGDKPKMGTKIPTRGVFNPRRR